MQVAGENDNLKHPPERACFCKACARQKDRRAVNDDDNLGSRASTADAERIVMFSAPALEQRHVAAPGVETGLLQSTSILQTSNLRSAPFDVEVLQRIHAEQYNSGHYRQVRCT